MKIHDFGIIPENMETEMSGKGMNQLVNKD